jgi:hypothetical protein
MTPTRPIVTVICLASLGVALFASNLVDADGESSGRSPLAREAEGFATALNARSKDALAYLTTTARNDPRVRAELGEVVSRLGRDSELMLSQVQVEPGGAKGQSRIQLLRMTPRGPQLAEELTVPWVRTEQGAWKASWDAP